MMSIKWGLSVLDWRDHAINDHHDHPTGVYKAQCGHSLMTVTPLRDTSCGTQCQACADAIAGTGPPP
jgi:hypothetical protein